MPFENACEQLKQNEGPSTRQLAWQPSAGDYQRYGASAQDKLNHSSQDLIGNGVLTDLQLDLDNTPLLVQAETNKLHQGYAAKTPELDGIDPSQLSPDAQFGGAAGNWARYLGRAAWHTLDAMGQPGATDQTIFGSIVNAKHYYAENSLQSAFKDISKLSDDVRNVLWNIPSDLQQMTPEQKSKASAEVAFHSMFFFFGAKVPISEKVVDIMELEQRTEVELRVLGIEKRAERLEEERVATTGKGSESLEYYISKPINGADRIIPLGFKDQTQFFQAADELTETLKDCGITDGTLGVRGSSVTGYSDYKGTLFHSESDVDFFVESAQIAKLNLSKGKDFTNPEQLENKFPLLKEWSERWTAILGRPISPAAFAPGKLPTTPAVKLERE